MDWDSGAAPRIVIIGAGLSGICIAIRLKKAGFDNVTLLESSDEVGGTWFKNSYPNAGCDIPSYLYCYSFAPNHQWSTKYARQPEILAYIKNCVERFGIRERIRFCTSVRSANFDSESKTWRVTTEEDEDIDADVLISATGQLNRPHMPEIDGISDFAGECWHSARWNHDCDLAGKDVAVIGNGASAIQFVPEIAKDANRLLIFQRSPSWIHPQKNYRYPAWARCILKHVPFAARLHRYWIFALCEARLLGFQKESKLNLEYKRWLRSRMRKALPPDRWSTLIPEYAPGCKRVLLSSDYLQTLTRENVEVVSTPIDRISGKSIVTADSNYSADVIVAATGFRANEFLHPIEIRGRDGKTLHESWRDCPKAHLGIAYPGFPNFFMLYGPNTNLGHNSILFMVECQTRLIIKCLRRLRRGRANQIEVNASASDEYNGKLRQRLGNSIWSTGCTSWYKTANGNLPNNWPGSAFSYWQRLRRARTTDFEVR